jgi:hypothetical protein
MDRPKEEEDTRRLFLPKLAAGPARMRGENGLFSEGVLNSPLRNTNNTYALAGGSKINPAGRTGPLDASGHARRPGERFV